MSTTIQIKRSSTASAIPVTGDIAVGELAVNLADKRLFTKQSDGTIIELSTNPTDLDAATLRIDGVEITASATELNSLDGFTGSTAELNLLDGLTASTIELNTLDGITASTAELNKLDGYTGSTAELNILDGVTATTAEINTLDGFTGSASDLNYAKDLRATGVTTAEFDKLDGLTATTTELNITDGLTATTAELNTLDGITASTLELNYTDGVTSNIQTQLDAMVEKSGDTMTGDLSLGDNNKATFGTGNDLQIYHDGSNSYVSDVGTGKLFLKSNGTATVILDAVGGALAEFHTGDKEARLYQAGSLKLATKSTGVDVTGTVTADGLTIDGQGRIEESGAAARFIIARTDAANSAESASLDLMENGAPNLLFGEVNAFGYRLEVDGSTNKFNIISGNQALTGKRFSIDRDLGDVSFYEDTGTTAKMVWDASAENLNITGQKDSTSLTLSAPLVTVGGGTLADYNQIYFDNTSGVGDAYIRHWSNAHNDGKSALTFGTSETGTVTERMRIDSAGNVGINTASPSSQLHVNQANGAPATITLSNTNNTVKLTADDGLFKLYANIYAFYNEAGTERARIDSSGNLLVGTTSQISSGKVSISGGANNNGITATTDATAGYTAASFQRTASDGQIVEFKKGGATVGSIGSVIGQYLRIGTSNTGIMFQDGSSAIEPRTETGNNDASINLGASTNRFKHLYLSGGVFLGGTGAANKLDDYEEGVWTPTIIGTTSGSATVSSVTSATYTKIGRTVHVAAFISVDTSTHTVVGVVEVGGLPFSPSSDSGTGTSTYSTVFTDNTIINLRSLAGNKLRMMKGSTSTAYTNTDLTSAASRILIFSAVYETTA